MSKLFHLHREEEYVGNDKSLPMPASAIATEIKSKYPNSRLYAVTGGETKDEQPYSFIAKFAPDAFISLLIENCELKIDVGPAHVHVFITKAQEKLNTIEKIN